ncbi:class I SAM-dependent methyltransferase [Actinokineospora soli]|uniref:Class I SAM-dependent methyltransferase n=1 Tax=Actinokineospora soli TaxID=1048753 RepID=A0ABW2TTD6_9PSEU
MNEVLARAWDEAADGYEAYFVPRFAPWVAAAVAAVDEVPAGPVLVPCCGTFPEADPLVARFPGREVVGIDLSAGMVRRANARVSGMPGVRAVVGDAAALDPGWEGRCAAVVSVFGLQQIPDALGAVRSWVGALAPGGRLSVVYWPEDTEEDGPFALMRSILPVRSERSWEPGLLDAVASAGATVIRDEHPAFPMEHADAETFFHAFSCSGPMRASALVHGEEFVARVRADFLRAAPSGRWTHTPRARLVTAVR